MQLQFALVLIIRLPALQHFKALCDLSFQIIFVLNILNNFKLITNFEDKCIVESKASLRLRCSFFWICWFSASGCFSSRYSCFNSVNKLSGVWGQISEKEILANLLYQRKLLLILEQSSIDQANIGKSLNSIVQIIVNKPLCLNILQRISHRLEVILQQNHQIRTKL